jgi:DNA-binding cell septation regulator SpoVG
MRVVIEKSQSGKTFGIALMDSNDKPYLVLKNCKLAKRNDGTEFISPPSVKMEDGKWINHAYISADLQDTVLATLKAMDLAHTAASSSEPRQNDPDFDDLIPI